MSKGSVIRFDAVGGSTNCMEDCSKGAGKRLLESTNYSEDACIEIDLRSDGGLQRLKEEDFEKTFSLLLPYLCSRLLSARVMIDNTWKERLHS